MPHPVQYRFVHCRTQPERPKSGSFAFVTQTNFSGKGYGDHFKPNGALVKGRWREEESNFFKNIDPKTGMNFSYEAKDVRASFTNYFGSEEGSVPWQDHLVDYDGYDETA